MVEDFHFPSDLHEKFYQIQLRSGADNQQNVAKSHIHSDWLRLTELFTLDKAIGIWNVVYHMNMKTSPNDISNHEILSGIQKLSSKVDGLDAKVGGLDAKVDGLDAKVDGLDAKVGGLDVKVDGLDAKVGGLTDQVDVLTGQVGGLSDRVGSLETGQAEILETIQGLAEHMDEEFSHVRREMVTKDELQSEMGKLQTKMVTKDYLDDKLADHHSAIILHTQREIEKALG